MNRTILAAANLLILVAVYFAIAAIYQSCGKSKETEEMTTGEKAVQVADTYTEESYFEDDETAGEEGNTESSDVDRETTGLNSSKIEETTVSQPPQRPVSTASATGNYLVVAGNYLVKSNADAMVARLKQAGYANSSHSVFDLSQYYTVIAGRYNSRIDANTTSEQLKKIGIDNYILTKK